MLGNFFRSTRNERQPGAWIWRTPGLRVYVFPTNNQTRSEIKLFTD